MWTKIKNWLFPPSKEEEDDLPYLIVWGVIEGPFTEYGELSEEDEDVPYYNLCKVSVDGEVFTTEIYFDNFESAYNLKRHFDKNVEPIYIPLGES